MSAEFAAFRLADSFLPDGSNSLSYGLEQFVADGRVTDAEDLAALLETHLRRVLASGDLVALRAAHDAARAGDLDGVLAADERLHATALAAELRESATRAGTRLLSLQRDVADDDVLAAYAAADAPRMRAVVLGVVAARAGVAVETACRACCHGHVTAMLGAAQRLFALGASEAQRVLASLHPAMDDAVATSADRGLDDLAPFAPLVDVESAAHERAERRLFLS